MEQSVIHLSNRRSGWSEDESSLLWRAADEAQAQGLPLKQVFEQVAEKTGRRPNSIRNYYYAQARERAGGHERAARFVPFTEDEVRSLVETVLRRKAEGMSVRACLQQMAGGSHSLMLRYQNKYRAVLRSRPEIIRETLERLKAEGVECPQPQVRARARLSPEDALGQMAVSARKTGDSELIQACDVFARLIRNGRAGDMPDQTAQLDRMNVRLDLYRLALTDRTRLMRAFCETADEFASSVKEYLICGRQERVDRLDAFCDQLTDRLGRLESCMTAAQDALKE
ncbi:MAG: hypothetical protein J5602_13035 [Clostridia bacterium]|nr:hypothetical protein [Clostridia bacterium]MBO4886230.1 hypothetical protein [Clostridia bacterium]